MVTFECDGSLTFRVYLPHAESVSLVASFTDWQHGGVPLEREAPEPGEPEGWWTVNVAPGDGDHAFSYLVDDQWWLPDYAAHGVRRNDEGSWTSLLFVPPPPRILKRMARRRQADCTRDESPEVVATTDRARPSAPTAA